MATPKSTADFLAIARQYGCSFGRKRPGLYYVTKSDGQNAREWLVPAKHQREVVAWIEANLS
jgi:hypothetical protein